MGLLRSSRLSSRTS